MGLVTEIAVIVQPWLHMIVGAAVILALAFYVMLVRSRDHARALREELDNTRELIDNLSEGIYRSSLSGELISGNPALARLNGCNSTDELFSIVTDIGAEWYVEPDRRQEFRQSLMRDGHVKDFISEVFRYKSRERIWVSEAARLVRDKKTGMPLYYEGSVREITQTMKRLKLEERFSKLMSQAPGALFQFTIDKPGNIHVGFVSKGFVRVTGIAEDVIKADPFLLSSRIQEEDVESFRTGMRKSAAALASLELEFRFHHMDGQARWLRMLATPERTMRGVTFHGYLFDMSLRKAQELEIERLAFYDPLTELPNRRLLKERIEDVIARRRTDGAFATLLFIDLDSFKNLNDSHGHDVGDHVLVEVARRLRNCVSDEGMVARLGGDEFVVVLGTAEASSAEAMEAGLLVSHRVLSVMRRDIELEAGRYLATASIGLVVFDGHESSADDVLKKADGAMYRAKAGGRDAVALHREPMAPPCRKEADPPRLSA